MMQQHSLIKRRIAANKKPEAVTLFFKLLRIFVEDLGLSAENQKLSLTVPASQKRFVVNLNSRYAITLEHNGSIGLLFEMEDYRAVQKICKTSVMFRFRKARRDDDYFLKYPVEKLTVKVLDRLLPYWIKACKNLEHRMSRSPYRKFHSREFYNLVMDEALQHLYIVPGSASQPPS